jgi:hypothetical protein
MSNHAAQGSNGGDGPQGRHTENSVARGTGLIEVHLRALSQLFDSLDHSPFRQRDLDRNAEEYIVDSFNEFPSKAPCALVIYLDQPASLADEAKMIEEAVHVHFARRAQVLRRDLHRLLRRGMISLLIGLAFLVTFFFIGQFVRRILNENQWGTLLRESLLIGGWVAMWKPLEIFLYDWWPLLSEGRLHDRLSRIEVRIVYTASNPNGARAAAIDEAARVSL